MITKPSLVWNMETATAGTLDIDLKYLASGISWKSDYVLNLKKDVLDLTGWITVNNNSGVAYKNADITCLAGEVNRAKEEHKYDNRRLYKSKSVMAMPMDDVAEESFSGYHIYKIPFRETIANKQQKQISFIDKKEIAYIRYGVASNSNFNKIEQKLTFTNTIQFKNTKENNLGIALPTGVVRMYQKDSSNETHFIGEQRVHNIPEDENVTLAIGTLFDAVGERTITKHVVKEEGYLNDETTYNIRNQGKEPLVLKIKEVIPTRGKHISVKTSCKDNCSVKKKNAFIREFTIKLKAKEKYLFTSEFEVTY